MTSTTERERLDEYALVGTLTDPLRRIVGARVKDPHQVDDLVQESLLRVLGARDRIAVDALLPYAVVVARNLAASRARREATAQRNAPRLLQSNSVEGPEDAMLRAEEAQAVGVALRALPNAERDALIAHELHGVQAKTIAGASSSTPGGVAAQLARARARMRVEYVVAIRGVDLPTAGCKPVLLALSMGDQRRQRALDAGAHLLTCGTCAELSEPLLTRKRVLAAIAPVGVGAWLAGLKSSVLSGSPVTQLAAATAATGVIATGLVLSLPSDETVVKPAPTDPTLLVGAGIPAVSRADLVDAARSDRPVIADDATVLTVPADEGFWIGNGDGRIWVQLTAAGESSPEVRTGQRLSFRAQPVAHTPGYSRVIGLARADGAGTLDRQPVHLRVAATPVARS